MTEKPCGKGNVWLILISDVALLHRKNAYTSTTLVGDMCQFNSNFAVSPIAFHNLRCMSPPIRVMQSLASLGALVGMAMAPVLRSWDGLPRGSELQEPWWGGSRTKDSQPLVGTLLQYYGFFAATSQRIRGLISNEE